MKNPVIDTDRLHLRLVRMSDVPVIHRMNSIPEVEQYNTLGMPECIEDTRRVIQMRVIENEASSVSNYTFAITLKESSELIGLFGFKLWDKKYSRGEVWYKFHPDYWGKGFATEALNGMLDFGFKDLGLHRIQAGCAVENAASIKVLEKVGMTREGRGRQILPLPSGWSDNFEYAILETDPRSGGE